MREDSPACTEGRNLAGMPLDGSVPSFHNLLDERMERNGGREDLQD